MSLVHINGSSSAASAADHDANCPCMKIAGYLRDYEQEAPAPAVPKAPEKTLNNDQIASLFDKDQIDYLARIQKDPHAFFAPGPAVSSTVAVPQTEESASVSYEKFECAPAGSSSAKEAVKNSESKKRIVKARVLAPAVPRKMKRASRKRLPESVVKVKARQDEPAQQVETVRRRDDDEYREPRGNMARVSWASEVRGFPSGLLDPSEATEDSDNAQIGTVGYKQFSHRKYKQVQRGHYRGDEAGNVRIEVAKHAIEADDDDDDDDLETEEVPAVTRSRSFAVKGDRHGQDRCDHQNIFPYVAGAAVLFALISWTLIAISGTINKQPALVPAPPVVLRPAPSLYIQPNQYGQASMYNQRTLQSSRSYNPPVPMYSQPQQYNSMGYRSGPDTHIYSP